MSRAGLRPGGADPVPVVVFDLDGTLLDSDAALRDPFVALGVPPDSVTFGHVLADECARLGIEVADYLGAYDTDSAQPFPGVIELLAKVPRWAVCSNKVAESGRAELSRLGWAPEASLFADDFGGPKRLGPVLAALELEPGDVVFVGDTDHDRQCAAAVGCPFILAAWNPRAVPRPGDRVAHRPLDVLALRERLQA